MINQRFRSFFPVVIDVETGGFNCHTDALLEIGAVSLRLNDMGELEKDETFHCHVEPFEGANIEDSALEVTGIDPTNPLRGAISEDKAIKDLFKFVRQQQKKAECQRSVLVGHNPTFDLSFIKSATERNQIKRNPLHPFTTFDTAALSAVFLGHTVLARACEMANIDFSAIQAHSALYDTEKTAELFCKLVNRYSSLGGWPLTDSAFKKE